MLLFDYQTNKKSYAGGAGAGVDHNQATHF